MFLNKQNVIGLKELKKISEIGIVEPIENSDFFLSNAFIKVFAAVQYVLKNKNQSLFQDIDKIIIDDSGLCVPALHFKPGVHSATYAGEPKNDIHNRLKLINEINKNSAAYFVGNEKRLPAFFVCFLFEIVFSNNQENLLFINNYSFNEAKYFVNQKLIEVETNLLGNVNMKSEGGFCSVEIPFSTFYKEFPSDLLIHVHYGFCIGEVSTQEQNLIEGAGHGYDAQFYSKMNSNLSFASITMEEKNKLSHRAFSMKAFQENLTQKK
ncbi:hypothetical protein AXG55_00040 [Silvanigrella aquatica]|uniref:Non-canonical purine NTP pyrophosphatase n=2 Tax=Silvanigrella aquatica TaxID=1915309 RepID=A0A1L4CWS9_9BACT|nr:hypothetical protein AXG55_00040 [Silvanigrella aquatica]